MRSEPLLQLRSFGAAFGHRIILADVTFDLPRTGLSTLVGPAGTGKSTLLRSLAGLNDAHPAFTSWGTAIFDGAPLSRRSVEPPGRVRRGIGLVMQRSRFYVDSVRENIVSALPDRSALDQATQTRLARALLRRNGLGALERRLAEDVGALSKSLQRRLAVVRAVAADPLLLLVDEATVGLEDDDAIELLALLRLQASERSVLFVTHNQRFARAAGGTTILLAGGSVRERAPARDFFGAPATASGRSFVSSGGCPEASPAALPEEIDPSFTGPLPSPSVAAPSRFRGPQGFFWVWPGRLGGLPRPGIVAEVEQDIEGLRRLGVTTLVTLEETKTVDGALMARSGIASIHFPVEDMGVPSAAAAEALVGRVARLLAEGAVVAFHCRAGLGRTGTLLACMLIQAGESARAAIDWIRALSPGSIQSDAQVSFLSSFEQLLRARPPRMVAADGVRNSTPDREEV